MKYLKGGSGSSTRALRQRTLRISSQPVAHLRHLFRRHGQGL